MRTPSERRWAAAAEAAANPGAVPFPGINAAGLSKMMYVTDIAIWGCRTLIRGHQMIVSDPKARSEDRAASLAEIADNIAAIAAYGQLLLAGADVLEARGKRDGHGVVAKAREKAVTVHAKAVVWAMEYGIEPAEFARLEHANVVRISSGLLG